MTPQNQAVIDELQVVAKMNDLHVSTLEGGHYQISGKGLLVNYYPFSKRRTAYVQGTRQGVVHCGPSDAVALALQPPHPKMMLPALTHSRNISRAEALEERSTQTGEPPWQL